MRLRNRVLPGTDGNGFYFLSDKNISDDGTKRICLTNNMGGEPGYSLWNVEISENGNFSMSPYEGTDSDELICELLEDFIENAFETQEKKDNNPTEGK